MLLKIRGGDISVPLTIFDPQRSFERGVAVGKNKKMREIKRILEEIFEERPEWKEVLEEVAYRLNIPIFLEELEEEEEV